MGISNSQGYFYIGTSYCVGSDKVGEVWSADAGEPSW